jgi:hypothetical protein
MRTASVLCPYKGGADLIERLEPVGAPPQKESPIYSPDNAAISRPACLSHEIFRPTMRNFNDLANQLASSGIKRDPETMSDLNRSASKPWGARCGHLLGNEHEL